jgi:hypothetical protein
MTEPAEAPKPYDLAVPLGLIWGVTGWAVGALFGGSLVALALMPSLVGGAAGCALGSRLGPRHSFGRLAASTLLAGAITGALAGVALVMTSEPTPVPLVVPIAGAVAAAGLAGATLPFLGAVLRAARSVGSARPGTLVDRVHRRSVWFVTVASLGALGVVTNAVARPPAPFGWTALGAIVLALAVLLELDVAALVRVSRLSRRVRPADGDDPEPGDDAPSIDLGVGEERSVARVPRGGPYRSAPVSVLAVRGTLPLIRRSLAQRVAGETLSVAVLALAQAVLSAPAPLRVVSSLATPHPPARAPAEPACGRQSWYLARAPIWVDVDGDGTEDIVGLRWGAREAALSVSATDGATLKPLWCTDAMPSQWDSPHTTLWALDDRLFLTDSEGRVHVFDVTTGKRVAAPVTTGLAYAWLSGPGCRQQGLWVGASLVDKNGKLTRHAKPEKCPSAPMTRLEAERDDYVCRRKLEAAKPRFAHLDPQLREDLGVALGPQMGGGLPEAVGYDPKICKPLWERSVALGSEAPHARHQLETTLGAGRFFILYQLASGGWRLGALDARTGVPAWTMAPPNAEHGSAYRQLLARADRLYVVHDWRLEIFDAARGTHLGSIPPE